MTDNSAYSGQGTAQDSTPIYPEQSGFIQPDQPTQIPVETAETQAEVPQFIPQVPAPENTLPPQETQHEPVLVTAQPVVNTPVEHQPLISPATPVETTSPQPDHDFVDPELAREFQEQMAQGGLEGLTEEDLAYQQYYNQQAAQQPYPPDYMQQRYDQRPQPEEIALEWIAASRPFKKRNRQYYTTIGVIVFLICMILFFAGQFLPIAVVIAVAFMAYVLSAVPPEMITNRITTYGVRTDDTLYYWEELGRFWFSDKYHQRLVHIETSRFPNQVTMVLNEQDEEELKDVLGVILLNEKPALTSFDKAAQWLQEKIPLDTEA